MLSLLALILIVSCPTSILAATNSTAADTYNISIGPTITKPGCPTKCGNLTVPYPFGINSGCSIGERFELNCSAAYNPPRAFLGDIEVYEISDGRMRISNVVSSMCFNRTGSLVQQNTASTTLDGTPFTFSDLNKFTVIGCDDFSMISGGRRNLTTACVSLCSSTNDMIDGDCSGRGCCKVSLPKGQQYYVTSVASLNNHTTVSSFNPCGYAFVGEEGRYTFRATDVSDTNFRERVRSTVPLVLDWSIGNMSCAQVENHEKHACKANSYCADYPEGGLGGYRCSCKNGYEGNPYLDPGCRGMDPADIRRGENSKGNKTCRSWTDREEEVLLRCMKEIVAEGWKSDNGFRAGYLNRLESMMSKLFPGTDLKAIPHINSKVHVWKKDYSSLISMIGKSGIGFCHGTNMIEATDEAWDSYKKVDTNARLMRFKTWPMFKDWIEIFGKDRATGEAAEDITDAANDIEPPSNAPLDKGKSVMVEDLGTTDENEAAADTTSVFVNSSAQSDKSISGKKKKECGRYPQRTRHVGEVPSI